MCFACANCACRRTWPTVGILWTGFRTTPFLIHAKLTWGIIPTRLSKPAHALRSCFGPRPTMFGDPTRVPYLGRSTEVPAQRGLRHAPEPESSLRILWALMLEFRFWIWGQDSFSQFLPLDHAVIFSGITKLPCKYVLRLLACPLIWLGCAPTIWWKQQWVS